METMAIVVWVYGTLVLVGGVMGWVKARSMPSLIAGIGFGAMLDVVGVAIWLGYRGGVVMALTWSLVLAGMMGVRFAKSKKFMPAGLVAAISVVVAVVLAISLLA